MQQVLVDRRVRGLVERRIVATVQGITKRREALTEKRFREGRYDHLASPSHLMYLKC